MSEDILKLCPKCGQKKPATLEYFHSQPGARRRYNLTSWCKECRNRQKRQAWGKKKERQSIIYFVQGADLIKIGRTRNLDDRLTKLQCGSPVPLDLLGTVTGGKKAEVNLHQLFEHLRQHGEWFKADESLLGFIDAATS